MIKTGNPLIDDSSAEYVIGSDECGLGSWAGELVVCGAVLPRNWRGDGAVDSKRLSEKRRIQLFERWTLATPVPYHIVSISSERIDTIGIQAALLEAHREVLLELLKRTPKTPLVVVDGFPHGTHAIGVPHAIGLPKADNLVPAVSIASIIGKVTHDEKMREHARTFPGYDFESNKGYRSERHEAGLRRLGPCKIHRRSYEPIRKIIANLGSS